MSAVLVELDSTAMVRLRGEIEMATVNEMMAAVDRTALDRVTLLVLDLAEVDFMDAAALRAVFRIRDLCEMNHVHLTVIAPRGLAGCLFAITRASEVLDVVDDGEGSAVTRGYDGGQPA